MANKTHLERLKRGVDKWNKWRSRTNVLPDLRGAFLDLEVFIEANLSGVDFRDAELEHTSFMESDLTGADFRGANLTGADFSGANLADAYLQEADLSFARLCEVSGDPLLMDADLSYANLWDADLWGADLTGVRLGATVFGRTLLQNVDGLETCIHEMPSVIDYETILISDPLPQVFLRGCGLPDSIIEFYNLSRGGDAFHSCFISYSHADKEFAVRLDDELRSRGVRCWRDEKDLLPGDDIHEAIGKNIGLRDRVLLCCSEAALTSWWVDSEIASAFSKEQRLRKRRRRGQILMPLNLDGYVFRWRAGKADEIRRRFIPDFSDWKTDRGRFDLGVEKIVSALRISRPAKQRPSARKR